MINNNLSRSFKTTFVMLAKSWNGTHKRLHNLHASQAKKLLQTYNTVCNGLGSSLKSDCHFHSTQHSFFHQNHQIVIAMMQVPQPSSVQPCSVQLYSPQVHGQRLVPISVPYLCSVPSRQNNCKLLWMLKFLLYCSLLFCSLFFKPCHKQITWSPNLSFVDPFVDRCASFGLWCQTCGQECPTLIQMCAWC